MNKTLVKTGASALTTPVSHITPITPLLQERAESQRLLESIALAPEHGRNRAESKLDSFLHSWRTAGVAERVSMVAKGATRRVWSRLVGPNLNNDPRIEEVELVAREAVIVACQSFQAVAERHISPGVLGELELRLQAVEYRQLLALACRAAYNSVTALPSGITGRKTKIDRGSLAEWSSRSVDEADWQRRTVRSTLPITELPSDVFAVDIRHVAPDDRLKQARAIAFDRIVCRSPFGFYHVFGGNGTARQGYRAAVRKWRVVALMLAGVPATAAALRTGYGESFVVNHLPDLLAEFGLVPTDVAARLHGVAERFATNWMVARLIRPTERGGQSQRPKNKQRPPLAKLADVWPGFGQPSVQMGSADKCPNCGDFDPATEPIYDGETDAVLSKTQPVECGECGRRLQ